MPFLMCVTSLRVCLWTPRRRLQHRIKLSRAFGCGVPACNPVLSRGEYWTRGTSRRCDEKSVHALVADGRRPSSRRIRFGFRLTRLRRVLRSMRELGWRETGSRLGLPRRASGPAASRVGPARTLTVVEPTAASETVWRRGRPECSRSVRGFPMGVKFPPRAYAIHCVHTGTATPDRHRGATSVFGPALVRWRPATARPDHVRPCHVFVWSLDVVVTVPLPLGRGPRPSSRLTPALPPRSSLHGARTSVSRLHGPDFRGASRLPARPVSGARGRASGARRPAPGGGR